MQKLGNSIERYRNGGAIFGFWITVILVIFFVVFAFVAELDDVGRTMLLCTLPVFIGLAVYMYFKSKTEIDLRENGIFVRTLGKKHEILYDEIAKFDKTKRIGKSGNVIITFYLLVIEKQDGERITFPCRVGEDFLAKLVEVGHFNK